MNHTRNTEWNTPQRQHVLDLHLVNHMRPCEIKRMTGMPTPTVRRVLRSNEPRSKSNPRPGRPEKLTPREIRSLIRAVIKSADGRTSSYMILTKKLGIQASEDVIRKTLCRAGFRRCITCPKSLISRVNRRKRLKWAREHLH